MDNAGWVKLYRTLLDNPVVMKDADHLAIWVYLLLNATHSEYTTLFKGEKIVLKPGQLVTGRKLIASELMISESKVTRVLNEFKIEQQIEQQTSNKNRLISIVNWDLYQSAEQQNEQQVNNNRTTSEQQANTNKNVKNIENVNKYINNIRASDNAQQDVSQKEVDDFFERVWKIYPNKKGKGQVSVSRKKILFKIGFDEISRAIERYKSDLAKEKWRRMQNGSTFFNSGYVDYLDANYEPLKVKPQQQKKNSFNNFHQREYAEGELERLLLNSDL